MVNFIYYVNLSSIKETNRAPFHLKYDTPTSLGAFTQAVLSAGLAPSHNSGFLLEVISSRASLLAPQMLCLP